MGRNAATTTIVTVVVIAIVVHIKPVNTSELASYIVFHSIDVNVLQRRPSIATTTITITTTITTTINENEEVGGGGRLLFLVPFYLYVSSRTQYIPHQPYPVPSLTLSPFASEGGPRAWYTHDGAPPRER